MIFLKCVMVRQYNIRMIRKENAMTCSVVITTEKTEKHFWYLAKDVVSGVASEGLTLDEAECNVHNDGGKCLMPSKYPVLPSDIVVKFLKKEGFTEVSQRGSHKKLRKGDRVVIVPMHDEIPKGTLRSILEQADISLDILLNFIR